MWDNEWQTQVDANTIGEYTGLKDKVGKKIFEGILWNLQIWIYQIWLFGLTMVRLCFVRIKTVLMKS